MNSSITKAEAKKLKALIREYAIMEVCDSWKGGGDPEDWPAIKEKLKQSKKKLHKFIDKLSERPT